VQNTKLRLQRFLQWIAMCCHPHTRLSLMTVPPLRWTPQNCAHPLVPLNSVLCRVALTLPPLRISLVGMSRMMGPFHMASAHTFGSMGLGCCSGRCPGSGCGCGARFFVEGTTAASSSQRVARGCVMHARHSTVLRNVHWVLHLHHSHSPLLLNSCHP
jgi:hypothetical protein